MPREASRAGWTRYETAVRAIVATGTSAEEYLTDLTSGFYRELEAAYFVVDTAGTGAGATRLFRVIKNTSTVAASKTIALADTATKGTIITLTLSTTPSELMFFDDDEISLDVTGAGTQFTALAGTFVLRWRTRPQQR